MSRKMKFFTATALAAVLCLTVAGFSGEVTKTVRANESDLSFDLKNGDFNTVACVAGSDLYCENWSNGDGMNVVRVPDGLKNTSYENDYCIKIDEKTLSAGGDTLIYNGGESYNDFHLVLESGREYTAGIHSYLTEGSSATLLIRIGYYHSKGKTAYAEKYYEISAGSGGVFTKYAVNYESQSGELATVSVTVCGLTGTIYLDDAFFKRVVPLLTESGAYFKLSTESAGLRFFGRADKKYVDSLKADGEVFNLSFGILIAPEDAFVSCQSFTVSELEYFGEPYMLMTANELYNEATAEEDGYYGFGCALVDIKESNLKRRFAVRTFLRYEKGYDVCFEYGEFDSEANVRSFAEVIEAARNDRSLPNETTSEVVEFYVNLLANI